MLKPVGLIVSERCTCAPAHSRWVSTASKLVFFHVETFTVSFCKLLMSQIVGFVIRGNSWWPLLTLKPCAVIICWTYFSVLCLCFFFHQKELMMVAVDSNLHCCHNFPGLCWWMCWWMCLIVTIHRIITIQSLWPSSFADVVYIPC